MAVELLCLYAVTIDTETNKVVSRWTFFAAADTMTEAEKAVVASQTKFGMTKIKVIQTDRLPLPARVQNLTRGAVLGIELFLGKRAN